MTSIDALSAVERRLLEIAAKAANLSPDEAVVTSLRNEEWSDIDRMQDWRNYVVDEMVEIWDELSDETRLAIFAVAERMAGLEWRDDL